jgi:threonine/homoserine/homoserine lactone efflux protein
VARPNFYAGLVINLLNPKAALFFITVMPQFIAGGQPSLPQGLAMATISVSIATGIHLALVFGAERMRPLLTAHNRAMIVRRVLAVGMLGVAAWFLAKAFV